MNLLENTTRVLRLIRFEHSVFALPFALISMLLAAEGAPSVEKIALIVLACVFARSAAMAFNRIVDLKYDRLNPRTANWELPAKRLSVGFVAVFVAVNCVLFVLTAYALNRLAFYLSPLALLVLLGYSYTKRFSWLSHFVLGMALGLAPAGAWVALRGDLALPPVILFLAVTLWTAGFDIIYSCQDYEFDRRHRLYSIPKRFGVAKALGISTISHVIAVLLFLSMIYAAEMLGTWYIIGMMCVVALLVYEHSIVKPGDLSRVNVAFFTVNGVVSILLFCFTLIDVATHG